jgi:hypothetical protein
MNGVLGPAPGGNLLEHRENGRPVPPASIRTGRWIGRK